MNQMVHPFALDENFFLRKNIMFLMYLLFPFIEQELQERICLITANKNLIGKNDNTILI